MPSTIATYQDAVDAGVGEAWATAAFAMRPAWYLGSVNHNGHGWQVIARGRADRLSIWAGDPHPTPLEALQEATRQLQPVRRWSIKYHRRHERLIAIEARS